MRTDWNPLLRDEFDKKYWLELQNFITSQRARTLIYPREEDVFQALHLTAYSEVRVLILGQDPYHGAGQANGLSFSVNKGIKIPIEQNITPTTLSKKLLASCHLFEVIIDVRIENITHKANISLFISLSSKLNI